MVSSGILSCSVEAPCCGIIVFEEEIRLMSEGNFIVHWAFGWALYVTADIVLAWGGLVWQEAGLSGAVLFA